jgi:hypothetical protein
MRFIFFIYLLSSSIFLHAQKTQQNVVGFKIHYGSIFIHTSAVKNVAGAKPYGAELEFSKQPMDTASFNKCNCFARNGVALSYFNFDTKILGSGAMVSYFIEPAYRLNKNLQLNVRGAAGLTYVSNPYDALKNPENKNYTTHINPYLQAGIGLGYNLNKNIKMQLMGNFQHFSNGAFKEPNRGVNWITGSVGILYYGQNTALPDYPRLRKPIIDKKIYTDAGILYVPKQGYNSKAMAQSKYIYGGFMQLTKQYGRISALTGGIEAYYNKLENQTGEASRWIAGIHAGHVFIFGKVRFSQQIGFHIYKKTSEVDNFYIRYGLLYRITNHLLAGISLKAHQDNADFTDFRIMYRF